jgi:alkylation response protein AidB-like acyl-CoA dehydrogenase
VGSDVQGIKSTAKKTDDGAWELNGQKMWVTNGLRSGVVFALMRTDPTADPPHRGMTCFITEKEPGAHENEGLTVPPQIKKMGYKGVESTELVYEIERLYRDAPLLLIGEGTSEIQRMVIGKKLLERNKI